MTSLKSSIKAQTISQVLIKTVFTSILSWALASLDCKHSDVVTDNAEFKRGNDIEAEGCESSEPNAKFTIVVTKN